MINVRYGKIYSILNYYPLIHAWFYISKVVDNCTFAILAMSSSNCMNLLKHFMIWPIILQMITSIHKIYHGNYFLSFEWSILYQIMSTKRIHYLANLAQCVKESWLMRISILKGQYDSFTDNEDTIFLKQSSFKYSWKIISTPLMVVSSIGGVCFTLKKKIRKHYLARSQTTCPSTWTCSINLANNGPIYLWNPSWLRKDELSLMACGLVYHVAYTKFPMILRHTW